MKKKTTWAASVVKKQLQTCCKHQAFSLETTGDDCNTSQGFGSPSRVIQISSPIRELQPSDNSNNHPVLQRRKSFNVLHGRSLLTGTPEPLTPFRKSVESAIPLCRSSSTFKSQRLKSSPEEQLAPSPARPRKVVLHKSGPLPVLQQLLRGTGGLVASPLHTVKKQLSGPLPGGRPQSGNPSPLVPRISKVTFSPAPPTKTQIVLVKDSTECFQEPPPPSSSSPEFAPHVTATSLRGGDDGEVQCAEREEEKDVIAAAVKIQAAYRGHRARSKLRRSVSSSVSAPSISTQMSRTDPQKQRRNAAPRVTHKGWNGSIRSAQDHQALLRSRQEAALKRERAMEYALSRQRWRSGRAASKPGWMITDDRVPDKPGWVRNWLERATRMSNQNSQQNRVFNDINPPESESLSMKSTVGMCTTDIGSVPEVQNLGWPLSLRQQHAAGLLQNQTTPEPPPPTPPPHKFHNEFSTSTADDSSDESRHPHVHYRGHSDDRESVGSCEGPVLLTKVPSPVVFTVPANQNGNKPRLQQQKASNSNSLKEVAKLRENPHLQTQVSVALSDGNSADTTMASIQRPLWR